jgi:hypothetical protein
MQRILSALDKYFLPPSDLTKDQEEEELIFIDICSICNCPLTENPYTRNVFYDDAQIPHHFTCKCIITAHQQCIENWAQNEYCCPSCEKPATRTPFLKTLWLLFEQFLDQNMLVSRFKQS